jgi:hypothetical protein
MNLPEEARLVRIFIGEDDRFDGKPLHEAIVEKARKSGIAGTTVLRGLLGFGAHSRIHTSKVLRLSQDLPIIIEIVDSKEKVDEFLPTLDEMIDEGLVTIEKIKVLKYRHRDS